jgi:hypothetical protein
VAGFQGTSTRKNGHEALAAAIEAERRELNTTLDATIISYDRATQRAKIQPRLERKFGDKTLKAPALEEIKIVMPGGGGYVSHYDMKPGDPVTVHFRQRSVDKAQTEGGDADGSPGRMHDLSDAIAIPGGGEDAKVATSMPAGGAHYGKSDGKKGMQVRADGTTALVGGDGKDAVTVKPSGQVDIKGPNGDSLMNIIREALVLIKTHLNEGAPVDGGTQAAATALIARLDGIQGT